MGVYDVSKLITSACYYYRYNVTNIPISLSPLPPIPTIVKKRLLPKFVALSGDEMYRVRKASGECLVDVSRALGVLPWRIHFGDVWMEEEEDDGGGDGERAFYKLRKNALALTRIVWHRTGRIPTTNNNDPSSSTALPYPPLMSGRPDPEDLKLISTSLLIPFIAMASCQTGEETTDAETLTVCRR
jgi:hypothetical protein